MHLNQQLPTPREHFCTKLLSLILTFFLHYYTIFARLAFKDIWHFRYTFSNIGVRNAL